MRLLWEVADFLRAMRRQMRFGELSRAPLKLLRVEIRNEAVECDWVARPADVWDSSLRRPQRDRNESLQALRDAIAVRHLVFEAFPQIDCAVLRVFRPSAADTLELVIAGEITREQAASRYAPSLAMQAKLIGFRFWLEDGILGSLQSEECAMSF
jgi:hypothetical protein